MAKRKRRSYSAAELLAAIRHKCMDCSGHMRSEVQNCKIKDCPLYPYRRDGIEGQEGMNLDEDNAGQGSVPT